MKIFLLIYKLSLFVSIIILLVGIYLKVTHEISGTKIIYRRFGTYIDPQTIDGNGTLILGVIIFLFAFAMKYNYKVERKKMEALKDLE